MALHPDFPDSPHAILDPEIRWFPADEAVRETSMKKLMPPLVATLRKKVKEFRDGDYVGATDNEQKSVELVVQKSAHVAASRRRNRTVSVLLRPTLEKYMEGSEPMPFIVDDILVDFDDERSEAALSALAELVQKTQVILFTHHSRVVEQARKIGGATHIHNL